MTLATINSLWIGPRLGPMSVACLRSFARHGHKVVLHVYERPEDAPPEIELADASKIMSKDRVVLHRRSGSFAVAADIFRLEMQAHGVGLWVDCDCYCVRPVEDDEYIFGWETDDSIGNGVLKIPQSSPLLDDLIRAVRKPGFVPPWYKPRRRRKYEIRKALGFPKKVEDMPWATIGPMALTYYAKLHGAERYAVPQDVFYPLAFDQAGLLLDPEVSLDHYIMPRTKMIHLWHNKLHKKADTAPGGSPLRIVMEEGAV